MNPRAALFSALFLILASTSSWADPAARRIHVSSDSGRAILHVRARERASEAIPKEITGKFAEHLGFNIYNGMDAQILRNPTFADYPFWNGKMTPDGVTMFHNDDARIAEELRAQARRFGWPESTLAGLVQARNDALACFWTRFGGRDQVLVSPDTGPSGGRAQRVAASAAGGGVAQWTWLPLHRQRHYEFTILARSPDLENLVVSLRRDGGEKPVASQTVRGLVDAWQTLRGQLEVPAECPSDEAYELAVTTEKPGQVVLAQVFLRPVDHRSGADPDVVRFLQKSHLPLLRWPGGNFVSTYHWEHAIGPIERRQTEPNFAWGALELNTFGTDEFLAFCREVGCEPMICINAGSGTPEEAARWVEYCNGPISSPMGRLRAANGHPEPYGVKRWEVGNELWGHWQMHWTTAVGYTDRFLAFAKAMRAADPFITLYSCGAPVFSWKTWNDTLIARLGPALGTMTDHPLIGGNVPLNVEPRDVYRDFMAVPEVLQEKWASLRDDMAKAGVPEPRLAVTELQLFAHLGRNSDTNGPVRLTRENLPGQGSITEAIYDVLIYHAALRLAPFVEMITHSATVNHGGGLRKERERVWANPCHYAQTAFAELAGATPVACDMDAPVEQAPLVLPDLRNVAKSASYSMIDALPALGRDGALFISIVNRSSSPAPVRLRVELDGFEPADTAQVLTLAAPSPTAGNSLEHPDAIRPIDSSVPVHDGVLELAVAPFGVLRVRVPPAR